MPLFDNLRIVVNDFFSRLKALLINLLFLNPYLFQKYIYNSVRSTGVLVHTGLVNLPFAHSLLYKLEKLIFRFDMYLSQTFNENTCFGIFSDLEPTGCRITWPRARKRRYFASNGCWRVSCTILSGIWPRPRITSWSPLATFPDVLIKQIRDLLHVYFKKAYSYSKLPFIWVLLYIVKNLIYCSWHKSILKLRRLLNVCHIPLRFAAKYGVSLSRPSLSISHYNTIKTIENILNNGSGYLLVCFSLLAPFVKYMVKEKISVFIILA